jgi:hypothetical protein
MLLCNRKEREIERERGNSPPMKSLEEAMPRCSKKTAGKATEPVPAFCNRDLATVWRIKHPSFPK